MGRKHVRPRDYDLSVFSETEMLAGEALFWAMKSHMPSIEPFRGWNDRSGTEDYGGSTWQTFSPGLSDFEKASYVLTMQALRVLPS